MSGKISIIVPVYNTYEYLPRCLQSICDQTYKNIEVICVDDGSADGSEKIVDKFAEDNSNFIVIHQENQGESAARNKGLECATGEYITFVDCDDWLEPDMYMQMIQKMEKYQLQLVAVGFFEEYDDHTKIPANTYNVEDTVFDRAKLFEYVYIRDRYRAVTSYLWCKLFKRELFYDNGKMIRFDEKIRFGADLMIFIQCASKVKRAMYINRPFYHYYQRKTSTSHSKKLELLFDIVEVYLNLIKYCDNNNIEPQIIPWLQRFAVYRATLIAELAIEQNDDDMLKKCQVIMKKYETAYIETNLSFKERLERFERLKNASLDTGIRLAICIPTYNRADIIDELLSEELPILKGRNVDIYIYDSSEGNETELVVTQYTQHGYDNLFFIKVDSNTNSNKKVFSIYRDMENSAYDFIWLIRDRLTILESGLEYIERNLNKEFSLCWTNIQKREFYKSIITDKNQFFEEAAFDLTIFGAVILNRETFLVGTDWDYYERKYLNKKMIHFSHVGYYLGRSIELASFKVLRLDMPSSAIKGKKMPGLSWEQNRMQIVTECWGSIIYSLPAEYKNKEKALKTQYHFVLSKNAIMQKKIEGQYNLFAFLKYRKWLKLIRPENYEFYKDAVFFSIDKLKNKYYKNFIDDCKVGKKVYIYGAGFVGAECSDLLSVLGIRYEAFLVSSMNDNLPEFKGHPVREAEDVINEEGVTIIIAISSRGENINVIGDSIRKLNGLEDKLNIIDYNSIRN